MDHAEELSGLGCNWKGINHGPCREAGWVGLQQEGHQYWVMLRNRVSWVAARMANISGQAVEQGGLGCNTKGISTK